MDQIDVSQIQFVENEKLTASEPSIRERKWDKPVDAEGNYNPSVELELWQFSRLKYQDQVDYLLHQLDNELIKTGVGDQTSPYFNVFSIIRCEHTGADGVKAIMEFDRANIRAHKVGGYVPVRIIVPCKRSRRRRIGSKWTYTSYDGFHSQKYGMYSVPGRPKIFRMLINLLGSMNPKYVCLKAVSDYYETSKTFGIDNPRKFKGSQ